VPLTIVPLAKNGNLYLDHLTNIITAESTIEKLIPFFPYIAKKYFDRQTPLYYNCGNAILRESTPWF